MNKIKILGTTSLLLLLSNCFLLFLLWYGNPKRIHGDRPKKEIIDRLHFDKGQIEQYEIAIAQHRKEIKQNSDNLYVLKTELYQTLTNALETNQKDSLLNEIIILQGKIESINYNHFLTIKQICRADQQADFTKLTKDLTRIFMRGEKKERPSK